MTITATSLIDPHQVVQIDPFGTNPMLEDAMQSAPATVALARAQNGEPPTMFVTGDTPPFLASGVDPRFLALLPWRTRRAAAATADAGTVLGYVEQYSSQPDADLRSPGLDDYVGRFRDWLGGRWTNPTHAKTDQSAVAAADSALYDAMFANGPIALAQQRAAHVAATTPITGRGPSLRGRAQR